ncbi:MAG: hypothetical protein A2W35_22160 [Chloroflexi bacterium RBG_16_57_11]|nr:MAG: hypothetical protein A2W35_22160 [Chloroflexi bacterium RBG_16_57_11]
MKTLAYLMILCTLCAVFLSGCAKVIPEPTDEAINPGDKIGDFIIITGDDSVFANSEDLPCRKQGEEERYVCESLIGKAINVSMGVYDDQYTGKLDELWSKHTYEMTINNLPVDLQAFGSIDRQHPTVGMMRHWNVVIGAEKPGELIVHSKGIVDGDPFEDTTTYVFVTP